MPKRTVVIAMLAIATITAVLVWQRNRAPQDPKGNLRVSGTIETTQVEMAFKIAGRLAERLVDEGQTVAAGDVVARLESGDQLLRLRQAEAEVRYARARLQELKNGSRPEELDEARAGLVKARAAAQSASSRLKLAREDLRRYTSLLADKVISQRDFETMQTTYETAQSAHTEATAQVQLAQARLDLVTAGPRAEVIEQASASLSSAEQKLELARQQLADTVLSAPMQGTVLSKSAEPGTYLNPGTPVLTLGDLDHVWLRAYIAEPDLGRIRLMQPAAVYTDSHPETASPGQLVFIAEEAEFTPKAVRTYEERVKLVYRIKIALANPQHALKPGMPADAVIELFP
jgi:HlyD family secretion protein